MGTEALWIPAVMSLVAAGTGYVNQRNKVKRQDRIALNALQQNNIRQRRADEVTQQLIQQQAGSTGEAEKKSTMSQYMDQLMRARPEAQAGLGRVSGASAAFRKDAENAALGIDQKGQTYADLASRLDAPALQREREARDRSDFGMSLGLIGREQEGADRVTRNKIAGVRTNPWLDVLSMVAGGVASGYGSGSAGTTGQPATAFGYNAYGG